MRAPVQSVMLLCCAVPGQCIAIISLCASNECGITRYRAQLRGLCMPVALSVLILRCRLLGIGFLVGAIISSRTGVVGTTWTNLFSELTRYFCEFTHFDSK